MRQQQVDGRYDVVVVGGGPAGLSGAVALARSRRSVVVVDAGEPRNAMAGHAHNYLGREGVAPARLLADGRAELAGYGGLLLAGRVTAVTPPQHEQASGIGDRASQPPDGVFLVDLADGRRVLARRLLLATGLTDELPAVPGLAQRWGRDVLHCPYCHGWEVRDQPIGVLATGAAGVHQAQMFRQLTPAVTLLAHTGPALSAEQAEQLAARGVSVVDGQVTGLVVQDDRLSGVRLNTGEVVALQALVVAPFFRANAHLLTALGLQVTEMRMGEDVVATHVAADPMGATAVAGVWAVGNVTNPQVQVISAAAAGLAAGAAINADLIAEDTRVAVTAHRGAVTAHRAALAEQAADRHGEPGHQYAQRDPDRGVDVARMFSQEFWDERYNGAPVFSGNPNPWLVHYARDLPPGTALDVGSGEGADVLWLASRGWDVTGADISPVALARCAQLAEQAGPQITARTTWQQADMLDFPPPAGFYDLVSAQFMHLPGPAREALHRRLAAAVRPGGTLLLVLHVAPDPGTGHPDFPADLFATGEQMATVLHPALWTIHTGVFERASDGSGSTTVHTHDAVLHAVRRPDGDAPAPSRTATRPQPSTCY